VEEEILVGKKVSCGPFTEGRKGRERGTKSGKRVGAYIRGGMDASKRMKKNREQKLPHLGSIDRRLHGGGEGASRKKKKKGSKRRGVRTLRKARSSRGRRKVDCDEKKGGGSPERAHYH